MFPHFFRRRCDRAAEWINDLDQVIDRLARKGMMIVLNPSPFDAYLDRCDWNKIDVFFINEVEVRRSAEKRRRKSILAWFREHHPKALVVLTLGGAGSCCMKDGQVAPAGGYSRNSSGHHGCGGHSPVFMRAYLGGQTIPEALALAPGILCYSIPTWCSRIHLPTMAELTAEQG